MFVGSAASLLPKSSFPITLAFGLSSILFVTPFIALLTKSLPLHPDEYVLGLSVFSAMPTMQSVSVALSDIACGNPVIALSLAIGSNILGVFTVPPMLRYLLFDVSGAEKVKYQFLDTVKKMCMSVLLPFGVGYVATKISRSLREIAQWRREMLDRISAVNIIVMVWLSVSAARDLLVLQKLDDLIFLILSCASIQLGYVGLYMAVAKCLRLPSTDARTLVVVAR
jgi:sodium/bile acid cotransporter 7